MMKPLYLTTKQEPVKDFPYRSSYIFVLFGGNQEIGTMNLSMLLDLIYKNKKLHILMHLLFWLVFLLLRWYLTIVSFNVFRGLPYQSTFWLSIASTACIILLYYTLVYLVLPGCFRKGKYLIGIIAVLLLFIGYTVLDTYLEMHILSTCMSCEEMISKYNMDYFQFLHLDFSNIIFKKVVSFGMLIGLLFNISVPLGIRYAIKTIRQNMLALKMSKDNIQLEYNFLKAQINPHFLFNTLNNIYGLVLQDNKEKSAMLIAKLSEFMRYTLYETDQEKMSVKREIELIEDYMELEKIRLNFIAADLQVHSLSGDFPVPPLLFIPLVENAFKFCPDQPGSKIKIEFWLDTQQLVFKCSNTMADTSLPPGQGGIGLQNLKKRLELYFPGKHIFNRERTTNQYTSTLILNNE